ncbi:hypothetical protein QR680_008920 [Steinernema hermaphroditum]|uniref:Uncharacterized protein n=1 Tax=Steinernema hermaphroditum TaxID=289476 RepID=A0AA39M8Y6_9BILA|nr:hypothetical protein QR680_008920 [Steinernema hermaphroditum]
MCSQNHCMISTASHLQPSCSSSPAPLPKISRVVTPFSVTKPVGFMSRKLNYLEWLKKNDALGMKMQDVAQTEKDAQAELQSVKDHINELKELIVVKRETIVEKKKSLKETNKQTEVSKEMDLKTTKQQHAITVACASERLRLDKKSQKIEEKRQNVDEMRRMRALELMTFFFPLDQYKRSIVGEDDPKIVMQIERHKRMKMIADAMADVDTPKAVLPTPTMGYWAAHAAGDGEASLQMTIKDNEFFSIADCRINDHCLYDNLRTYLIYNRSTDISMDDRQAYAAFAHCVHVLHNLSVILDYKLPYEISLTETMKHRWTANLFDTTVFKVNVCIVHLCLAHGTSPEAISFHRPFYNLFNLCSKFRSDLNADPPVPITPCKETPELAKIIKEEYEILTWEDTKDMDDWIKI